MDFQLDVFNELKLADPNPFSSDIIDVVLRADIFAKILLDGVYRTPGLSVIAQQTTLGWILSGSISPSGSSISATSLQCHIDVELNQLVERFWEQESFPTSAKHSSVADSECERHYRETHSRTADG